MSVDLKDLYQQLVLDHARAPRNRGTLEVPPARRAEGYNPLCGDRVEVFVRLADDRLEDIAFEGEGCAISIASASLMAELLQGGTTGDAERLFQRFHDLVMGRAAPGETLEQIEMLAGVSRFPMRVKCATLPWHTVRSAIEQREGPVTTE